MPLNWNGLSVAIASTLRVRCEPGWSIRPYWSQRLRDFDLWFVFAGQGAAWLDGQRLPLRPGVCFWHRPGVRFLAEQHPEDRLGVNAIHFELVTSTGQVCRDAASVEAAGLGTLPDVAHDLHDVNYVDAVMRRVVELIRRDFEPEAHQRHAAATLLTGLLSDIDGQASAALGGQVAGTARHHRDLILRVAASIAESPADAQRVEVLAQQAGYTPDHFSRLFRQQLGMTPRDFIVRERIERARQLLIESGLSIGQIAHVLGYRDVYFFSRQFKAKMGQSPSQYRKRVSQPVSRG